MWAPLLLSLPAALWTTGAHALGQQTCVSYKSSSGAFAVAASGAAAPIYHAPEEDL
jgi:hypothetical protein